MEMSKAVEVKIEDVNVNLTLNDCAGLHEYSSIRPASYKGMSRNDVRNFSNWHINSLFSLLVTKDVISGWFH